MSFSDEQILCITKVLNICFNMFLVCGWCLSWEDKQSVIVVTVDYSTLQDAAEPL